VRATGTLLVTLIAAVSVGSGCSDTGSASDKPQIVATTTQAADLVRNVAGDRADVTQLLRPGADPHEYEPRPSDARAVATADLIVSSGGDVDEWLADLVDQAGGDTKTLTLIDHVERHDDDPHWWQDPTGAQKAVAAIRDALVEADPGGATTYRRNARAYGEELIRLDGDVADCTDRIPAGRRKLVTSHDSLGYYARRYGFHVIGAAIPSLSSQAQPSAASTDRLVRQIREQRVPAIFPENALNPKLERAIAREAHARVAGGLYADALGPTGSAGATYEGALRANTRTIAAALTDGRLRCHL
jgi:ABC-type Zn uptake system ZnuABC Zn-binding protein ZnuA